MLDLYIKGFIFGFTLHISLLFNAIYQNSFILLQGVAKRPVFIIALGFSLSAFLVATIGIYGLHSALDYLSHGTSKQLLGGLGSLLLLFFAAKNYLSAKSKDIGDHGHATAISGAAAITMVWLTPHVYIDMALISTTSVNYQHVVLPAIILGFSSASFLWFFSLAFFSQKISQWYNNPSVYKILQYLSAIILVVIAIDVFKDTFLE